MTSQLNADFSNSLSTTRETAQGITELTANGWTLERQGVALTLRCVRSDPRSLYEGLSRLFPVLTDGRLSGRWPSHELELEYVDGGFALADASPGDLREAFAGPDLDLAQDAWGGDVEAAMGLSGSWTATAHVDLAQLLQNADTAHRWYVLPSVDAVCSLFREHPWWDLSGLLEPPEPVMILVCNAPHDLDVHTARIYIRSLAADIQSLASLPPDTAAPTGVDVTRLTGRPAPGIPAPLTLAPSPGREPLAGSDAAKIYVELWRCCAATAWAWLATAVEPHNRQSATLEFFGLQRTRHDLQSNGPIISIPQCRASYEMWQWTTGSDSPDQLLASRQVISLYRDVPPWPYASDIQSAAEPVFVALRSDATAEAFRMQREARSLALTVARETADAAIGLAKGAVERCLAALVAIGGVIVAQTSRALTDSQAFKLHLLIGIFLIALAVWSALVEGPTVSVAIDSFPKDIGTLGELLSAGQRQKILDLQTFKKAQMQSRIVRVMVPIAYTIAAAAAFTLH
jgi:hypothetical protein